MDQKIRSLRPFIGSKGFDRSQAFYKELGFEEIVLSQGFSLFQRDGFSFYLQDAYVKDWNENTMLFVEVSDVEACYAWLKGLELEKKYEGASLKPIRRESWGAECFLLDPSGVLLHFGQFNK
jgi:hypothetical protein